jgi:hypothetical protein
MLFSADRTGKPTAEILINELTKGWYNWYSAAWNLFLFSCLFL